MKKIKLMNEQQKNLQYQLTRLKAINNISLIPTFPNNNKEFKLPNQLIHEWTFEFLPNLNECYDKFNNIIKFLKGSTAAEAIEKIKVINQFSDNFIVSINQLNEENTIDLMRVFDDLKSALLSLINQKVFLKEIEDDLTLQEKEIALNFILKTFSNSADFYKREFNKLNSEDQNNLLNKLIFAYNRVTDNTYDPLIFDEINQFLIQTTEKNIRSQEVELKEKEIQTNIRIESAKNESTIIEFKKKAEDLKVYIYLLNAIIVSLFITIILIFFQKYFNHPKETIDFLYSLTLVIAISSFIAFLIKEKNVLSNQYHNYMKCHTELVAMATYVVDIDKNKSEDLKVRLAEKYFTGYLNDNKESTSSFNNNDSMEQLVNLLKEIQKK